MIEQITTFRDPKQRQKYLPLCTTISSKAQQHSQQHREGKCIRVEVKRGNPLPKQSWVNTQEQRDSVPVSSLRALDKGKAEATLELRAMSTLFMAVGIPMVPSAPPPPPPVAPLPQKQSRDSRSSPSSSPSSSDSRVLGRERSRTRLALSPSSSDSRVLGRERSRTRLALSPLRPRGLYGCLPPPALYMRDEIDDCLVLSRHRFIPVGRHRVLVESEFVVLSPRY
ncbi:hypothetical protein BDZ91DRAFT_751800 [Kalaharituber pfeilii]|nr:hypothetical protein BDZ91DRAFT_751800 [Kalaharituber pfeilii]